MLKQGTGVQMPFMCQCLETYSCVQVYIESNDIRRGFPKGLQAIIRKPLEKTELPYSGRQKPMTHTLPAQSLTEINRVFKKASKNNNAIYIL